MRLARERGETFAGFAQSRYASGDYFTQYLQDDWQPKTAKVRTLFARSGITLPTREMWLKLRDDVMRYGIYNQNLQAVPPTGSISYINHATSSIHPIVAKIEIRKEGKTGRVYYPAPFMTNENLDMYQDAYDIGPEKLLIPMPRPRATSIKDCRSPCFPRYRHDPRYQQSADLCGEKVLSHCITSGFASWRWKVLKLKAAYPARYKESHMKLSRISAINWNKIRDDKDLRYGTG